MHSIPVPAFLRTEQVQKAQIPFDERYIQS